MAVKISNRYIVISAVAMIAIQYTVVGVMDIAAPHDSYATRNAIDSAANAEARNVARLERILAPSPELDYASRTALQVGSLSSYLDALGDGAGTVPPIYLRDIPDFSSLEGEVLKESFIAFMLPLVLRANEELKDRRALIDRAVGRGDINKLRQWADLYGFRAGDMPAEAIGDELKKRAAPVPVSIALAQAAVESGWGKSRFAIEGNALFGQRTTNRRAGIEAREAERGEVILRAFKSPFESVHFYMHNLNSNRAYEDFRILRSRINRPVPGQTEVALLVRTLTSYSERGDDYTRDINNIIRTNNLTQYDSATLGGVS